jgi:hypothetical protein
MIHLILCDGCEVEPNGIKVGAERRSIPRYKTNTYFSNIYNIYML